MKARRSLLVIFDQEMLLCYHYSLAFLADMLHYPFQFFKKMRLATGTASSMWPKWPLHLVQSMDQVSHLTPFSVVSILKSYRVLHSSSCLRGIFPCNNSTMDWLRTSWSDDIEKSIALISLLNIFWEICSFLLPESGVIPSIGSASLHFAQNYPSSAS